MNYRVLVIDDDPLNLEAMRILLTEHELELLPAENPAQAFEWVRTYPRQIALALVDFHLPEMDGATLTAQLHAMDPSLSIAGFSGDASVSVHNATMEAGAVLFIQKDLHPDKLIALIKSYCRKFEETSRVVALPEHTLDERQAVIAKLGLIGRSEALAAVAELVMRYAPQKNTVLILGENGSGKERIARALHDHSSSAGGPFVAVNCAALTESLMESELFGHERGAFTGALQSKIGKFQLANGGTIFLDEVGDMSPQMQVKLLRVLQEKEVMPVGSNRVVKISARVVAATNVDLEKAVSSGRFREDLYYRLKVLPLTIPPLRERVEDIELLVAYFCEQFNRENNSSKSFLARTVQRMATYRWPGNVRELEHEVTRLLVTTPESVIEPSHLDQRYFAQELNAECAEDYSDLKRILEDQERRYLSKIVQQTNSLRKAATKINLSKSTLQGRLKILGINLPKEP